jgi:hypothetical protein
VASTPTMFLMLMPTLILVLLLARVLVVLLGVLLIDILNMLLNALIVDPSSLAQSEPRPPVAAVIVLLKFEWGVESPTLR